MPNAGHIIIKSKESSTGINLGLLKKKLFAEIDRGSMMPAWSKRSLIERMKEEVEGLERNLKEGVVDPEHKTSFKNNYKQRKERYEQILQSDADRKIFVEANKDALAARRKELAATIRNGMPTETESRKKKVNPYRVIKQEQEGFKDLKLEYKLISHALDEEANISYLQRD